MLSKNKPSSIKIGTATFFILIVFIECVVPISKKVAVPIYAAEIHPMAGTTSASFLKIGVGARAVAMGEAFSAIADDVNAIYWNPAGLCQLIKQEATAMHNEWFQNIRHEYVAYAYPLGEGRTLGIGLGLLYLSDIERRSWIEETPETQPQSAEGLFGATDFAGTFSYSQWLYHRLMGGVNLKFIYERIDVYSAYDVALDFGLLYKTPIDNLKVGFNLQNLGPKIKFREKAYFLPINAKLGLSYKIPEWDLLLSMDLNQPIDNYLNVNTGAEYLLYNIIAFRAGYRYKWFGNDLGALSGLTAGAGFKISNIFNSIGVNMDTLDLQLDYAFVPFGDLGSTHRVSLNGSFGIPVPAYEAPEPRPELPLEQKIDKINEELLDIKKEIKESRDNIRKEILDDLKQLINELKESIKKENNEPKQ